MRFYHTLLISIIDINPPCNMRVWYRLSAAAAAAAAAAQLEDSRRALYREVAVARVALAMVSGSTNAMDSRSSSAFPRTRWVPQGLRLLLGTQVSE